MSSSSVSRSRPSRPLSADPRDSAEAGDQHVIVLSDALDPDEPDPIEPVGPPPDRPADPVAAQDDGLATVAPSVPVFAVREDSGAFFPDRPVSVGVVLGDGWGAPWRNPWSLSPARETGGASRIWEAIADSATGCAERIELSLYFANDVAHRIELAANVAYFAVPPNGSLPARKSGQLRVEHLLAQHEVLVLTDASALSRAALRVARRNRVTVIDAVLEGEQRPAELRKTGGGRGLSFWRWFSGAARENRRRGQFVAQLPRRCQHALISAGPASVRIARYIEDGRASPLRCGVDPHIFSPRHRNRLAIEQEFHLDEGTKLVLMVDGLHEEAGIVPIAESLRRIIDIGEKIHLIAIGSGHCADILRRMLGPCVNVSDLAEIRDLPWLLASADLLLCPEVRGSYSAVVAVEAQASGVPVLVPFGSPVGSMVSLDGHDGVVVRGRDQETWTANILALLRDGPRRAAIGYQARRRIEREGLRWDIVLREDFLPVCERLAAKRRAVRKRRSS